MNSEEASKTRRIICRCIEIGVMEYSKAGDLQHRLVERKKNDRSADDFFILLEHPSVFTLGRNAGLEHLKVSKAFLASQGIPLIQVERGGDITYHGPGQLVGYPIVDLHRAGLSVGEFVEKLETVMIRTVADWGLAARRNPLNRGIWCHERKLGSIGVAIRRGVSFHGFALNVNTDLKPFEWINPCGLSQVGVTSMATETSTTISVPDVRRAVRRHIQAVFKMKLEDADPDRINAGNSRTDDSAPVKAAT